MSKWVCGGRGGIGDSLCATKKKKKKFNRWYAGYKLIVRIKPRFCVKVCLVLSLDIYIYIKKRKVKNKTNANRSIRVICVKTREELKEEREVFQVASSCREAWPRLRGREP